jgi:hypothetical protein
MTRAPEGFHSETLRAALEEALAGNVRRLAEILCSNGGIPGPRPNLKLAAAFGEELSARKGEMAPLLSRFASEDAAADSPAVFLPVAAAHGWAARLRQGREVARAWQALFELSADVRAPVRIGVLDAWIAVAAREGLSDELLTRAQAALELPDRDERFATAALLLEVLSDDAVLAGLRDHAALRAYLSSALEEVVQAPRAAERSWGRLRMLLSLPGALAHAVTHARDTQEAQAFFEAECEKAEHPDVRAALNKAVDSMRRSSRSHGNAAAENARRALERSQKPARDHARVRPGTGRGRDSRRTR